MAIERVVQGDRLILKDRNKTVLTMQETLKDDCIEIILEGELRSEVRHPFGDELNALILLDKHLKIDLAKVTYLSSNCSLALIEAQQKADDTEKGSLCLKNVPAAILEEMKANGMAARLMIE